MRRAKEEPSSSGRRQAIDLISAVKELHRLSPQDLSKLIRDSENNILQTVTESGSSFQIDVEKLARFLPMHLMAKLMSSERDEALFKYLLCGIRLLHSLLDIAPRHSKLEQILLDDVKVSDQLLDLVFFLVIVLCNYRQEHHTSSPMPLLHSALVSCSLYLLTGCISSQWQDLASVLVVHSKVDIFMDAACAALRVDIKFLHIKLSGQYTDLCTKSSCNAEGTLISMCQQCEASLQFLQSLCQQKSFRERLVKNKELCGKGGILLLVRAILNLKITPLFRESSSVVAAVSRLKSKILTILLHLCEAESISYLDEIASTPQSMNLAKSVALEIYLEESVQEVDCLNLRIQELEMQLCQEKEDCKRITSKIKKFVKAHNRYSRLHDELKRSHDRLQKLGDHLGSDAARLGANEDSSINILSDGETTGNHAMSPPNQLQKNVSPNKKRLQMNVEAAEESKSANLMKGEGTMMGTIRLQKNSRWNMQHSQYNNNKEAEIEDNGNNNRRTLANEDLQDERGNSY